MKKGTKFYSIFHFKCPHCHEGEFYVDRNPYHLSTAGDLLESCSVCHRKYEPEPGFYYGGMYVTYGLAVATFAIVYLALLLLLPEQPLWLYAVVVLATLVVLAPWYYALSKPIWATMFMTYKGVAETPEEHARSVERAGTGTA